MQQSHFWLYNQRTISKRYLHAYIHFHHDSQQQRYGDNLRACRLMGLADVASKHSGVLLSHEKEGKAAIGNNMDGP